MRTAVRPLSCRPSCGICLHANQDGVSCLRLSGHAPGPRLRPSRRVNRWLWGIRKLGGGRHRPRGRGTRRPQRGRRWLRRRAGRVRRRDAGTRQRRRRWRSSWRDAAHVHGRAKHARRTVLQCGRSQPGAGGRTGHGRRRSGFLRGWRSSEPPEPSPGDAPRKDAVPASGRPQPPALASRRAASSGARCHHCRRSRSRRLSCGSSVFRDADGRRHAGGIAARPGTCAAVGAALQIAGRGGPRPRLQGLVVSWRTRSRLR